MRPRRIRFADLDDAARTAAGEVATVVVDGDSVFYDADGPDALGQVVAAVGAATSLTGRPPILVLDSRLAGGGRGGTDARWVECGARLLAVRRRADVPRAIAVLVEAGAVVLSNRRCGNPFRASAHNWAEASACILRLAYSADGAFSLCPVLEQPLRARLGNARTGGPTLARTLARRTQVELELEAKLCRLAAAQAGADPAFANALAKSIAVSCRERIALAQLAPSLSHEALAALTNLFGDEPRRLRRREPRAGATARARGTPPGQRWSWWPALRWPN